ncbi:hypothetical protein OG474_30595 [Kribbella sp. NBC_01505]|uniref:hypothetical protein n=1 Tax=Kribbella sp. NBC_01505 TaxID=2903580 RepID=UPI00386CB2F5
MTRATNGLTTVALLDQALEHLFGLVQLAHQLDQGQSVLRASERIDFYTKLIGSRIAIAGARLSQPIGSHITAGGPVMQELRELAHVTEILQTALLMVITRQGHQMLTLPAGLDVPGLERRNGQPSISAIELIRTLVVTHDEPTQNDSTDHARQGG